MQMWLNILSLIVAFCGYAFLGYFVWRVNPRSRINIRFSLFALNLALWAYCVLFAPLSTTASAALFYIRLSHVVGAFIPGTFLLFALAFPENRPLPGRKNLLLLQLIPLSVAALSLTPRLVRSAELSNGAPVAVYGPLQQFYYIYMAVYMAVGLGILLWKLKQVRGIKRLQVSYVFYGAFVSAIFPIVTNVISPKLYLGAMETYSPLFPMVWLACIAYAIAKYHLMDITVIIKRTTLYAVLTASITAGYIGLVLLSNWLFGGIMGLQTLIPAMIAALLIAFAFAPLKEGIQRFIDKTLFKRRYDHREIIGDLSRILTSIFSLDELLDLILRVITEAMGIDRGAIYFQHPGDGAYVPMAYKSDNGGGKAEKALKVDDPLARSLLASGEIIIREQLERRPPSIGSLSIIDLLKGMDFDICVPIFSKERLAGMLLLGSKETGETFTREDIDMFSTLSHHIAVAIENAQLYSKVEEGKIYQEILLNSLTSGVIAINFNARITAFNKKAESMLGIGAVQAIGHGIEILPSGLRGPLILTLKQGEAISSEEITVRAGDENELPVAVSTSLFKSYEGKALGALVVFSDLTERKELEAEMRRADRLASLGTLAAGMAHEIKNPLVSLKTFTQLMPEKYRDREFRERFSRLATQEVDRINHLVEQLLDFARPVSSSFQPTSLPEVLENTLFLLKSRMEEHNIQVEKEIEPEIPEIMADAEQLKQVFINIIINAFQSMEKGGVLGIAAGVRSALDCMRTLSRSYDLSGGFQRPGVPECAVIAISDTGHGIDPKDVSHLFDPFFTTRESGVGLGLAIAHSIIEEHGGVIDVRSAPGEGTTFTIAIPLIRQEAGRKK